MNDKVYTIFSKDFLEKYANVDEHTNKKAIKILNIIQVVVRGVKEIKDKDKGI